VFGRRLLIVLTNVIFDIILLGLTIEGLPFLNNWDLPNMCAPLVGPDDLALVMEGAL
jgi:hypothetical protein